MHPSPGHQVTGAFPQMKSRTGGQPRATGRPSERGWFPAGSPPHLRAALI